MLNYAYSHKQLRQLANVKGIDHVINYLSPEIQKQILKKANALQQHQFTFEHTWDMEACSTPYIFQGKDWNVIHHDDEEWCFMLNRMEWGRDLILASVLDTNAHYEDTYLDYLQDFMDTHQEMKVENSTRTLDTGIRIMSIFEAIPYLLSSKRMDEALMMNILRHLYLQMQYLKEHYLPKYRLSNWGSIQTCAMVTILPVLLENYEENELYQWALQELTMQLQIQIYEDGMQWEQSTMYHVEVLNALMKTCVYANMQGRTLPSICETTLYSMIDTLSFQLMSDHRIEAYGDSDRVNACDVFIRGAIYFHQPTWKFLGGNDMDADSFYLFGSKGADVYSLLSSKEMPKLSYDGIDCGMYTTRSSWKRDANFTLFTNGSVGSGHGHCDQLHVSLAFQGLPFLIDSGRYTYREDHPLRPYLKSMEAHNSIVIDDCAMSQPKGSWSNECFAKIVKPYVKHSEGFHYYEGMIHGENPLQYWKRKLMVADCGIWMFVDEVECVGNHQVNQYFHLDPKVELTKHENYFQLKQENVKLSMHCEYPMEVVKQPCSFRYNELEEHDVIKISKAFQNHQRLITYFFDASITMVDVPVYQGETMIFSKDIVEAKKFIISDRESYIFVIFHQEIYQGSKLCSCDGISFHAKSVVIHVLNHVPSLYRLKA